MVLQGKEIQKHLQPQTVQHIAVVKVLPTGFVIHHPNIGLPVPLIQIQPVHKAPELGRHGSAWDLHRGHGPTGAKLDLEARRLEPGLGQLLPQFPDHGPELLEVPFQKIVLAAGPLSQAGKVLPPIPAGILHGQLLGPLQAHPGKAPGFADIPGRMLQNVVHKCPKLCRVYRNFFSLPGPEAIAHEVGKPAGGGFIHLRSGKP